MNRVMALMAGYGAFELKQAYRRNMLIGFIVAGLIHLMAIGTTIILQAMTYRPVEPLGTIVIPVGGEVSIKPPVNYDYRENRVVPKDNLKSFGPPVAVPDEEIATEAEFYTQDDIAQFNYEAAVESVEGLEGGELVIDDISELLPEPDEFVAYEEAPAQLEIVTPIYPEIARRAGMEATVWIKALVDKNGAVRDAIILKTTNENAGFEEAARDAAMKTAWKPAISNGQPIAVWVAYKIEFKLASK